MNPHGGQDWWGFLVVAGIAIALSLVAYADALRAGQGAARRQRLVDDAALAAAETETEADHIGCVSEDCDLVLCYCRGVDAPCEGTVEPGCRHPGGEFVCEDHRLGQCRECRIDARDDARDDAGSWR